MRKILSLEDKRKVERLYKECGNVSEVARQTRLCRPAIYAIIKKHNIKLEKEPREIERVKVDDVVADKILKRIEKNPDIFSKNFEQLSTVLGSSNVVAVMRNPEKYDEATRKLAQTGVILALGAMVMGEKLSQASPNAIASALPILCDIASGKFKAADLDKGHIDKGKIIESIQIGIRRIRSFNPVLAKDVQETLEEVEKIDKEKAGKVLDAKFKEVKNESVE